MPNKKLKLYEVSWMLPNAGSYVPPDPAGGGDYYADLYVTQYITAYTAKSIKEGVKKADPRRERIRVKPLIDLD